MKIDIRKIFTILLVSASVIIAQDINIEPLKALNKYVYSNDDKIPTEVFKIITDAKPKDFSAIENELVHILKTPDVSPDAKALICRMLQRIGSDACVPVLIPMLKEEPLSGYARIVLERIASPTAKSALRSGLEGASIGAKIGIITSLGELRDSEVIGLIGNLISDKNYDISSQAIIALGKIGGMESHKKLLEFKPEPIWVPSYIKGLVEASRSLKGKEALLLVDRALSYNHNPLYGYCVSRLMEVAPDKAIEIIKNELRQEKSYKSQTLLTLIASEKASDHFIVALSKFSEEMPPHNLEGLIKALGATKNQLVVNGVLLNMNSPIPEVKAASIEALAMCGDFEIVKKLLKLNDPLAFKALAKRDLPDTDTQLIDLLNDPDFVEPALEALSKRSVRSATPRLLDLVGKSETAVQTKAWKTLGLIGEDRALSEIAKVAFEVADSKVKESALACVKRMCERSINKPKSFEMIAPFYAASNDEVKSLLIELAALGGNESALNLVKSALTSGKEELIAKAVRSLAVWPNVSAAPDLLEVAKNGTQEKEKLIALRGYIQLASNKLIQMSPEQRGQILKEAIPLVTRSEEKMLVASALAFPCGPAHVDYATEYLKNEETRSAALVAIKEYIRIAGHQNTPELVQLNQLVNDYGKP